MERANLEHRGLLGSDEQSLGREPGGPHHLARGRRPRLFNKSHLTRATSGPWPAGGGHDEPGKGNQAKTAARTGPDMFKGPQTGGGLCVEHRVAGGRGEAPREAGVEGVVSIHRGKQPRAVRPRVGWVTLGTRRRVCVRRRWAQGRAEAWEPGLLGKLRIWDGTQVRGSA